MSYTIHEVAKIAGVSIRTLHYYDEIGLLKPGSVRENGYREYGDSELSRLQQIMFFRELEFPLQDIRSIMASPGFNADQALSEHKKLLEMKKQRLEKLIATVDSTLRKGDTHMADDDFRGFADPDTDKYREEAKARWGNTEAWRQSQERLKHLSQDDLENIKRKGEDITSKLAAVMDHTPEDDAVQALIAEHHGYMNGFFDMPYETYRNITDMYVDDSRFTAYYDRFKPGLAVFIRDAAAYYCDRHKGKPERFETGK